MQSASRRVGTIYAIISLAIVLSFIEWMADMIATLSEITSTLTYEEKQMQQKMFHWQ